MKHLLGILLLLWGTALWAILENSSECEEACQKLKKEKNSNPKSQKSTQKSNPTKESTHQTNFPEGISELKHSIKKNLLESQSISGKLQKLRITTTTEIENKDSKDWMISPDSKKKMSQSTFPKFTSSSKQESIFSKEIQESFKIQEE